MAWRDLARQGTAGFGVAGHGMGFFNSVMRGFKKTIKWSVARLGVVGLGLAWLG